MIDKEILKNIKAWEVFLKNLERSIIEVKRELIVFKYRPKRCLTCKTKLTSKDNKARMTCNSCVSLTK